MSRVASTRTLRLESSAMATGYTGHVTKHQTPNIPFATVSHMQMNKKFDDSVAGDNEK